MNFQFHKEVKFENLIALIRPLLITDTDNLLTIATEDDTLVQFSPKPIHSKELLTQYIEKAVADRESGQRYPFIIFDKTTNTYAGSTSFLNISNANKKLEIGETWIGRGFHKTGLNRNCKYLLLSYAFDELGAERVEFKTDERNSASRKAIEGIGGQFEGILRKDTIMIDGFRRSTAYYGILRDEWETVKQNFSKQNITA